MQCDPSLHRTTAKGNDSAARTATSDFADVGQRLTITGCMAESRTQPTDQSMNDIWTFHRMPIAQVNISDRPSSILPITLHLPKHPSRYGVRVVVNETPAVMADSRNLGVKRMAACIGDRCHHIS